ncbi:MAG: hypothetical protein IPK80_01625 [Nannocystis sp.]|nr:hypothetical protein [Nannocystis sp.]
MEILAQRHRRPLADIRDTALRLDKQLLRVAQGDEHTHGLNGPRGFISRRL